jgi:hypothetical protein
LFVFLFGNLEIDCDETMASARVSGFMHLGRLFTPAWFFHATNSLNQQDLLLPGHQVCSRGVICTACVPVVEIAVATEKELKHF